VFLNDLYRNAANIGPLILTVYCQVHRNCDYRGFHALGYVVPAVRCPSGDNAHFQTVGCSDASYLPGRVRHRSAVASIYPSDTVYCRLFPDYTTPGAGAYR